MTIKISHNFYAILFYTLGCFSSWAKQELANSAEQLTYYTEHYPPSNYLENNVLKGISYDTLRLIWQDMGIPKQNVIMASWARGYRELQTKKNTVLFSMSRTHEREHLFKWVGPIYEAQHVLIAKHDFPYKINSIDDVHPFTIAAIRDDISEVLLKKAGIKEEKIALLTSLKQSFLMLNKNRIDMLIISRVGLSQLLKENDIAKEQVKELYTVKTTRNYYAFHIETKDKLIAQFQLSFNKIVKQRQAIKHKYGITN